MWNTKLFIVKEYYILFKRILEYFSDHKYNCIWVKEIMTITTCRNEVMYIVHLYKRNWKENMCVCMGICFRKMESFDFYRIFYDYCLWLNEEDELNCSRLCFCCKILQKCLKSYIKSLLNNIQKTHLFQNVSNKLCRIFQKLILGTYVQTFKFRIYYNKNDIFILVK